jgi:hypothetical protein
MVRYLLRLLQVPVPKVPTWLYIAVEVAVPLAVARFIVLFSNRSGPHSVSSLSYVRGWPEVREGLNKSTDHAVSSLSLARSEQHDGPDQFLGCRVRRQAQENPARGLLRRDGGGRRCWA